MISITPDGGVRKEVLEEGTGLYPVTGNEVEVRYVGRLENGRPFDGTPSDRTFVFRVGKQEVVKGWDEAAKSMRVGERSRFVISPEYGYGVEGKPPLIPPNSTLLLEIELVSTTSPMKEKFQYNRDEKLVKAQRFKEMGTKLYQEGFFRRALVEGYVEGLTYIEDKRQEFEEYIQDQAPEYIAMRVVLHSNAAQCAIKIKAWAEVIKHCSRALKLEPKNAKLLYRRATGYLKSNQIPAARADINIAMEEAPTSAEILQLHREIRVREQEEFDKERRKRSGWLNRTSLYEEKPVVVDEYLPAEVPNPDNPKIFLDLKIGETDPKRIICELFHDVVPRTSENFRVLCTGEKPTPVTGKPLSYQGSLFHKVTRGVMMQGGDLTYIAEGAESIYGALFEDENFRVRHARAGLLSMASTGPASNGFQFFITLAPAPQLDGKHVAFGRVIEGLEVLGMVEDLATEGDRPSQEVRIVACGAL